MLGSPGAGARRGRGTVWAQRFSSTAHETSRETSQALQLNPIWFIGHVLLSTWLAAALKVSIFYGLWLTQP